MKTGRERVAVNSDSVGCLRSMSRGLVLALAMQYGVPVLLTFVLWVSALRLGRALGSKDDFIVSAVLLGTVLSSVFLFVFVLKARASVVVANSLCYWVFITYVGIVQDQWLSGLASVVKSFPSDTSYMMDVLWRILIVLLLGLLVRFGRWLVGLRWRHPV